MKTFIIILTILSFSAYAVSDIAFTPDTVLIGGKTCVSGKYASAGGSADIFIFIDRNNNGIYDEGIDPLSIGPDDSTTITDGEWSTDTIVDGLISGELDTRDEPFCIVENYTVILTDEDGADTTMLTVKMLETALYVSGKVLGPDGPLPEVAVRLETEYDVSPDSTVDYAVEVLSGPQGDYLIYIPELIANTDTELELTVWDYFDFIPQDLIPPGPDSWSAINMGGPVTDKNLTYVRAEHFISGVVVDENDEPVVEAPLKLTGPGGVGVTVDADQNGLFIAPVTEDEWVIELNLDDFSGYMSNSMDVNVGPNDDTVNVTFIIHSTDTVISGVIIDESGLNLDFSWVCVEAELDGSVEYTTFSYSDREGNFSLDVSSKLSPYSVYIATEDNLLPDGYEFSVEGFENILPGTDTLRVVVRPEGIGIDHYMPLYQSNFKVWANSHTSNCILNINSLFSGETEITLFAINGRQVGNIFRSKLHPGINRIMLKNFGIENGAISSQNLVLKMSVKGANAHIMYFNVFIAK